MKFEIGQPQFERSDDNVMSRITSDFSKNIAAGKDAIIISAILDSYGTEITMANCESFKGRGRFEMYSDKTEVFYWDEKPLIQFQPLEIKQEGMRIIASQPYRLLITGDNL